MLRFSSLLSLKPQVQWAGVRIGIEGILSISSSGSNSTSCTKVSSRKTHFTQLRSLSSSSSLSSAFSLITTTPSSSLLATTSIRLYSYYSGTFNSYSRGGASTSNYYRGGGKIPSPSPSASPTSYSRGVSATNKSSSTFVSKHYVIEDATIEEFLHRLNLVYRKTTDEITVQQCPFCHPTKGDTSNFWKLSINRQRGFYNCLRCAASGSWFDFKQRLQSNNQFTTNPTSVVETLPKSSRTKIPFVVDPSLISSHRVLNDYPQVLDYFTQKRNLKPETLKQFRVGVTTQQFTEDNIRKEHVCIVFPWTEVKENLQRSSTTSTLSSTTTEASSRASLSPDSTKVEQEITPPVVTDSVEEGVFAVRYKLRALDNKRKQRILPTNAMLENAPEDSDWKSWGMFGWHLVPPEATEIVITEGEFDAMAVYQETGIPTVSLPNGASSFPIDLLQRFERFTKIYLWMDDDLRGREGANKFAQKLGIGRCWIVTTRSGGEESGDNKEVGGGPKDANEALLAGKDLNTYLRTAKLVPHSQIIQFGSLRHEVFLEISNKNQVSGIQSKEFVTLNQITKGFRKGELTVVTGPTGSGKTSFLSQYSLDFARQGVPTLWGSFEIANVRLVKKMLTQSLEPGEKLEENFPEIVDRFAQLPLHFLKFYGSTSLEQVLDAMEYAVYALDVEHIVLDNLQFMTSGQAFGYQKFDLQDHVIAQCRQFATNKNVHISLVIHPRKEDDNTNLSISSVFGSAKATQEADNVIIIQKQKKTKYLDVRKNRFDGDLGRVTIEYNKSLERYIDKGALADEDLQDEFGGGGDTFHSQQQQPPIRIAKKKSGALKPAPKAIEEEAEEGEEEEEGLGSDGEVPEEKPVVKKVKASSSKTSKSAKTTNKAKTISKMTSPSKRKNVVEAPKVETTVSSSPYMPQDDFC